MLVSLIVPTLNRSQDLFRLLDSIDQAHQEANDTAYEVIVVEQGDCAYQDRLAAYPAVRFFFSAQKGLSHNRNFGVSQAKGDVFLFTDDDCVLDRSFFITLNKSLEAHPEVAAFCGRILELETRKPFHSKFHQDQDRILGWNDFQLFMGASHLIRRSLWEKHQLQYNETLGAGAPYGAGEETYLFYQLMHWHEPVLYLSHLTFFHPAQPYLPPRKQYQYAIGNGALHGQALLYIDSNPRHYWVSFFRPWLLALPKYGILKLVKLVGLDRLVRRYVEKFPISVRQPLLTNLDLPLEQHWLRFLGFTKGMVEVYVDHFRTPKKRIGKQDAKLF